MQVNVFVVFLCFFSHISIFAFVISITGQLSCFVSAVNRRQQSQVSICGKRCLIKRTKACALENMFVCMYVWI